MTNKYRLEQLENARRSLEAAREDFKSAKGHKAKQDAADDVEAYAKKVDFLSNEKISTTPRLNAGGSRNL